MLRAQNKPNIVCCVNEPATYEKWNHSKVVKQKAEFTDFSFGGLTFQGGANTLFSISNHFTISNDYSLHRQN